jgi:DNA-binding XRE family transcriptional regulator
MPTTSFIATIIRARQALGWTQRELGDNLGVSLRTATRWEGKRAHMGVNEAAILARHVYPKRPDLAEELVAAHGQTLVGLGIAPPPPPPAPPVEPAAVVPPPPPPRAMAARDLVDCIVCAVADAANVAPKAVRGMVLLTLRRAEELGMDLGKTAKEGALSEEVAGGPTVAHHEA